MAAHLYGTGHPPDGSNRCELHFGKSDAAPADGLRPLSLYCRPAPKIIDGIWTTPGMHRAT